MTAAQPHSAVGEFVNVMAAVDGLARLRTYSFEVDGGDRAARLMPVFVRRALAFAARTVQPPRIEMSAPEPAPDHPITDYLGLSLRDARERFERLYLAAQLERHHGNISATARAVGMDRAALHRKLKDLGVIGEAETPMNCGR